MKNIKSLLIVGLLIVGQSSVASDNPKVPSDFDLHVMKSKKTLYSEVAAGSAATVACGVSVAIALKNKGGANAGSYIGCAALYTALRQAVNIYQIDKEIEAAEIARKIAAEQKKAEEKMNETSKNNESKSANEIVMKHTWGFGSFK